MSVSPSLRLSQRQRLALTPSMRQSLACLQMSADTLREEIAREAADNPFLEVIEAGPGRRPAFDVPLDQHAAPVGLYQSLAQQIGTQRLDPLTEAAALVLAAELREDGYLDEGLEEIARACSIPAQIAERALDALQRCDPPGVGARSLAECLELQLADKGIDRALARRCIARIDRFAEGAWPSLARHLALTLAEVQRIAAVLRTLTPAPVQADDAPVTFRTPDLIAETGTGGTASVRINPAALPTLRLAHADAGAVTGEGLRSLFQRAGMLIDSVAQRQATLLRIARHIVAAQNAFFQDDARALVPAIRRDAALALGMHPSTLGRAIRDKSLVFQGRVHPLSFFFQTALPGPDGAISAFEVQRRLQALILAEDPDLPLADDDIAAQLRKEGVDIARRTVAKYRKCLRIPSSFERRRRRAYGRPAPL